MLGYPVTRVRRRRRLVGLWNPNPNHRHWTKEEIVLLGTRPDREVAPFVNRTLSNVRNKRLELGQVEIATRLKRTVKAQTS